MKEIIRVKNLKRYYQVHQKEPGLVGFIGPNTWCYKGSWRSTFLDSVVSIAGKITLEKGAAALRECGNMIGKKDRFSAVAPI